MGVWPLGRFNRKWCNSDKEEYEKRIVDFFSKCIDDKKKPTISGLALALNIGSTQTIREYSRNRSEGVEEIAELTSWGLLMIEEFFEGNLHLTQGNPAGSIFWLKNQGWSDAMSVEHNVDGFEALCRKVMGAVMEQEENGQPE